MPSNFAVNTNLCTFLRASFNGSRGWANELKRYDEPVKVMDLSNTMIVQALPHHYPMVMENLSPYLVEMAYWLGLKKADKKVYKDYLYV